MRLLQLVGFVFDVGQKYVPKYRNTVNIQDPDSVDNIKIDYTQCSVIPPELRGNKEEVDSLTRRPDDPVE